MGVLVEEVIFVGGWAWRWDHYNNNSISLVMKILFLYVAIRGNCGIKRRLRMKKRDFK